jgi:hypothetical protein
MADRLADIDERAGDLPELFADLCKNYRASRPPSWNSTSNSLTETGHDVIIPLRTSGPTTDAFHLGNGLQKANADFANLIRLLERSALARRPAKSWRCLH